MNEQGAKSDGWYRQPMRWLQLNLVEDDALRADVAAWGAYWHEARVDGITVSAAGAAAYYPTTIENHRRARWLGERDLFGEITAEAKRLGMRVLARFEPNFVTSEIADRRPDWIVRSRDGTMQTGQQAMGSDIDSMRRIRAVYGPLLDAGDGVWPPPASRPVTNFGPQIDLPRPCFNGPYHREFIPAVMRELGERYPIDGFYANGWPSIGIAPPDPAVACHCDACLGAWQALGRSPQELPSIPDPADDRWRDYVALVQDNVEQVQALWQETARSIRPSMTFACNLVGSLATGLRWQRFRPLVDLVCNDGQMREPTGPAGVGAAHRGLWGAGRNAQVMSSIAGDDPQVFHIVGGWHAGKPLLRRLGRPDEELTLMLAQAVAKGTRPWVNVAGGVVHDRRWMPVLAAYYQWHAANETYLRDQTSTADVALLWSPESVLSSIYRPVADGPSPVDGLDGWYLALLESRIPAALVADVDLQADAFDRFAVVIVPSGSRIGTRTADLLRQHAARGGGLILGCGIDAHSGEHGHVAEVITELTGAAVGRTVEGPFSCAYLATTAADRADPLLHGIGDTDYVPAGSWLSRVSPRDPSTASVARFVPPLPFFADLAFEADDAPKTPGFVRREQVVMLASDVDCDFGRHLHRDHRRVMANAVEVARGSKRSPVRVSGSGLISVDIWRQHSSCTVHLVNMDNPRLYAGQLDEIVPLGSQRVELAIDRDASIERVTLLRGGVAADWSRESDGSVVVEIPSVTDFEVVAVDAKTSTFRFA